MEDIVKKLPTWFMLREYRVALLPSGWRGDGRHGRCGRSGAGLHERRRRLVGESHLHVTRGALPGVVETVFLAGSGRID
jgi:hypothetical protein